MKHMFDAIKFECMTSIRASLKTCDYIVLWGKNVHNLSLSFIAPLKT